MADLARTRHHLSAVRQDGDTWKEPGARWQEKTSDYGALRLALQQEPRGCTPRHSLPSPASVGFWVPSALLSPTPEVQGLCTCKDFISTSQQDLPSKSILARPTGDQVNLKEHQRQPREYGISLEIVPF